MWSHLQETEELSAKRYVYNRDSKELSVVSDPAPAGLGMDYCSGDYMSWSTGDFKDRKADSSDVVGHWKN